MFGQEFGDTPLGMAASKGYSIVVKLLVEHGADINQQVAFQFTVYISASV